MFVQIMLRLSSTLDSMMSAIQFDPNDLLLDMLQHDSSLDAIPNLIPSIDESPSIEVTNVANENILLCSALRAFHNRK